MPRSNSLEEVEQDLRDQLRHSNQEIDFLVDREMSHAHRHELILSNEEER